MSSSTSTFVLKCGDVVTVAGARDFEDRLGAAVLKSPVSLYQLRRFSTRAAAVVAPDPLAVQGIVRQAAEAGVPVLSEQQALDAIALLNTPRGPGWCDCAVAVVPATIARTWEDHRFGVCGWPERRCDTPEHRKSWCRACRRVVRLRYCSCGVPSEFSHDRARDWWVHAVCGWPTRAWFVSSGAPTPDSADGTPSWLWRVHEGRSLAELSARPLPDKVKAADQSWATRMVQD